jgi:hypothetical protein
MKIVTTAATLLVLSAATVWAQTSAPAPVGQPSAVGKPGGRVPAVSDKGAPTISPQIMELRQRMQAMQDTLTKMHAVLKEMRAKAASRGSKDQLTKANITMWELMLGQLDKDFEQLSKTTLTREDIEARRAAMYKQAMAKAAARREAALAAHEGTTPAAASQDSPGAAPSGEGKAGAPSSPGTGSGAASHSAAPTPTTPTPDSPK